MEKYVRVRRAAVAGKKVRTNSLASRNSTWKRPQPWLIQQAKDQYPSCLSAHSGHGADNGDCLGQFIALLLMLHSQAFRTPDTRQEDLLQHHTQGLTDEA